jgi:hypothetical protein
MILRSTYMSMARQRVIQGRTLIGQDVVFLCGTPGITLRLPLVV